MHPSRVGNKDDSSLTVAVGFVDGIEVGPSEGGKVGDVVDAMGFFVGTVVGGSEGEAEVGRPVSLGIELIDGTSLGKVVFTDGSLLGKLLGEDRSDGPLLGEVLTDGASLGDIVAEDGILFVPILFIAKKNSAVSSSRSRSVAVVVMKPPAVLASSPVVVPSSKSIPLTIFHKNEEEAEGNRNRRVRSLSEA